MFVPSNLPASSIDRPSEVDASREASDIGTVMRCSSNTTELARNWFADLAPEIFDWNTSALSDNNNPSIILERPVTVAARRSPPERSTLLGTSPVTFRQGTFPIILRPKFE